MSGQPEVRPILDTVHRSHVCPINARHREGGPVRQLGAAVFKRCPRPSKCWTFTVIIIILTFIMGSGWGRKKKLSPYKTRETWPFKYAVGFIKKNHSNNTETKDKPNTEVWLFTSVQMCANTVGAKCLKPWTSLFKHCCGSVDARPCRCSDWHPATLAHHFSGENAQEKKREKKNPLNPKFGGGVRRQLSSHRD